MRQLVSFFRGSDDAADAPAAPDHSAHAGRYTELNDALGEAVHVDPIKPKLKPLGRKLLKLRRDVLRPNFAFKLNLGRFSWGSAWAPWASSPTCASSSRRQGPGLPVVRSEQGPVK
jgi:hypothetical protein